jgi:RNA polymerase sigma-70 factor, ECF subfamily
MRNGQARLMNDRTERVYEELLVLRCQMGSESAFAEVVRLFAPRLRCYLRRLIGNADDAEDTLQEVWTDVYKGLGRLRNTGAFTPWLYRIARDRAYRQLRRKRVPCVPLEEGEVAESDGAEPSFGPEDAQQITAALERISAEYREVLLLRFIEGMSAEQIGQVIGRPAGTVRSRLHYAKRCLRREIERGCEDEREGTR